LNEGKPINPKDADSVYFDDDVLDQANEELKKNDGALEAVTFSEPEKVKYKNHLLSAFKDI